MKILLVDDNQDVLKMMSRMLAHRGHQVQTCMTPFGVSALIVRERFDLVVLDVMMPGLAGPDLAQIIGKLELSTLPVLVLWSAMDETLLQRTAAELNLPAISKTTRPSELVAALERLGQPG